MAKLLNSCIEQFDQILNLDHVSHINFDSKNLGITFQLANSVKGQTYVYWAYKISGDYDRDIETIISLSKA